MSFPRYPRYKPSGIEWLVELPHQWNIERVRWLCKIQKRIVGELGYDVLSITQRGIKVKDLESNDGQISMDYSKYQLVQPGDFAMNHMDLLTGWIDVSLISGVTSPDYRVFSIRDPSVCDPRYLLYIFQMGYSNRIFYAYGQGSSQMGRWRLPTEQFNDLRFPVPPRDEQIAISTFLDRETAKIDELVVEQERLIELLKQKRQAAISHVVTKGLNSDAPMKPSGVQWLGDVPAHWKLSPLKYVVNLRSGGTPSKTNPSFWDGDVPWASSKDLKTEDLYDTEDHISQIAVEEGAADLVPAGALLIVVRGMILIHTFPVAKTHVPMAINQDLKALTPCSRINVDFLAWLLRGTSSETLGRVDEAAHGTKVLRIDTWASILLPIPPLKEQLELVSGIVANLSQLDRLMSETQRAIDLLQGRRSALISAAVTGQIDVRGLVDSEAA